MTEAQKKTRIAKKTSPPDYVFIGLTAILTVFGFIMLSSASSDIGARLGDSYFFVKHQFINFLVLGIPGFFLGLFFPYRWLKKIAVPFFILSLILLALVFVPGIGIHEKGASRWINIAGFQFQPGEVMKLAIILFFSVWLSKSSIRAKSLFGGFLPFFFILGTVMSLFFLQPSTSAAVIIGAACVIVYFVNGLPLKYVCIAGAVLLLVVTLLIVITPYRGERMLSYGKYVLGMDPGKDFDRGDGFQMKKILFAMRSGGIYGVGFGGSTTKTTIPEVEGDAIFSVIGEEFGFIGCLVFISIFGVLIWRGFHIAQKTSDDFGKSVVIGFTSIIALQSIINFGAISGIFPLTGVPLPFTSFGGTALAVFLTMSGIIANISMYRRSI
jgi:cell division protein FtsW